MKSAFMGRQVGLRQAQAPSSRTGSENGTTHSAGARVFRGATLGGRVIVL